MRLFGIAALAVAAAAACAHNEPAPTPAPAQPAPQAAAAPAPAPAPQPPPQRELQPASIYFAYDSSDLTQEARTTLQSFYDESRNRADVAVRIEGNCDERGSREYNLALGQRRADSAKDYLERLGVPASRISTVSNGKEKPRATGHDESGWKENRRADLVPRQQSVGQLQR